MSSTASRIAASTAQFVATAMVANALVFSLGFDTADPGGPPGWFVGLVWIVLFAMFGAAHGLLRQPGRPADCQRARLVAFAALCLAYPVYTEGLSNPVTGLIGNIVTAIAATLLAIRVLPISPCGAALIAPVVPWLIYASWLIVQSEVS